VEPTAEQQAAIDAAGRGGDVAIEALAGTGKTSTLTFVARAMPRRAVYIAFNKAIVTDAKAKFGPHVDCRTAHSLAFRVLSASRLDRA